MMVNFWFLSLKVFGVLFLRVNVVINVIDVYVLDVKFMLVK